VRLLRIILRRGLRFLSKARRIIKIGWSARSRATSDPLAPVESRFRGEPPLAPEWLSHKVIAWYLPQFHPTEINDELWGEGFTEWTNVQAAVPLFSGHNQPRAPLPTPLGNYVLDSQETYDRQVQLARSGGIFGFSFYLYEFGHTRLLNEPLERLLTEDQTGFPFCFTWANEDWTRAWDGLSDPIVSMSYSEQSINQMLEHYREHFLLNNYIKIDGKPLFLVYRWSSIPVDLDVRAIFQRKAEEFGFTDFFLVSALTFDETPSSGPADAWVQFPPHQVGWTAKVLVSAPLGTSLKVVDYNEMVDFSKTQLSSSHRVWPGITLDWDNTSRRGAAGTIVRGFTESALHQWLEDAVRRVSDDETLRFDEEFIFVNAWNEWAEGTYLEPDVLRGYSALQVLRSTQPRSGRSPVLIVVHDAMGGGSQLIALHFGKRVARFGHDPIFLTLDGSGLLLAEMRKLGRVVVGSLLEQEQDSISRDLFQRGVHHAFVFSLAAATVTSSLVSSGINVTQMVNEFPGEIEKRKLSLEAHRALLKPSSLVFPTEVSATKWREALEQNILGPHAILPQGMYQGKREGTLEKLNLGSPRNRSSVDIPTILGVGYGDYRKGFDRFLEACSKLEGILPIRAVWVGSVDSQLMKDTLGRLKLTDSMVRRWFTDVRFDLDWGNIAQQYLGADLLFVSSREDPFPSVVLEATSFGIPSAVVRGCTGSEDFLSSFSPKCVLDPQEDLADQLHMLLQDIDLRGKFADTGPSRIVSDYNYTRFARRLLAIGGVRTSGVSVVIPTYNSAEFLEERLRSIEQQTVIPDEVVIVDDGSDDETISIANRFRAESQLEIHIHQSDGIRRGVFGNWLRGVGLASGELVWVAEADDSSDSAFLEQMLMIQKETGAIQVVCDSVPIDRSSAVAGPSYFRSGYLLEGSSVPHVRVEPLIIQGAQGIRQRLLPINPILNVSACLFSRPQLFALLTQLEPSLAEFGSAADWVIYGHLAREGKIAVTKQCLNYHRRHSASVVSQEVQRGLHGAFVDKATEHLKVLADSQRS
jgi:glycosyltransferase involved in cell wall biosynthesis